MTGEFLSVIGELQPENYPPPSALGKPLGLLDILPRSDRGTDTASLNVLAEFVAAANVIDDHYTPK